MARLNTVFKEAYNRVLQDISPDSELASEPELAARYGISRTTVRSILGRLRDHGLIDWDKRRKIVLRPARAEDHFSDAETSTLRDIIERDFMRRILTGEVAPGSEISEAVLARDLGIGTTAVREFLIRFSRFGVIDKRPNSCWVLKGFTRQFALELAEIREMFEYRSALAFGNLPPDHPAWEELAAIKSEHRDLLADLDRRFLDFSALDARFHLLIHRAAPNRFILDFHDVIAFVFHYHYQWNQADARNRNARAIGEHLAYIDALESRDALAIETACTAHLRSARDTMMASFPS